MIMTAAVVEHPHTVIVWEEGLDAINTILKLEGHVIVSPVALFSCPVPIFKVFNEW
jgi:hypothetical protein